MVNEPSCAKTFGTITVAGVALHESGADPAVIVTRYVVAGASAGIGTVTVAGAVKFVVTGPSEMPGALDAPSENTSPDSTFASVIEPI